MNTGDKTTCSVSADNRGKSGRWVPVAVISLTLLVVGLLSPTGLIVLLADGIPAAALLIVMVGCGFVCVRPLRFGTASLEWQVLVAAVCGIGGTSTLVLILGLLGHLERSVIFGLLGAMFLLGLILVHGRIGSARSAARDRRSTDSWHRAWLLIVPFSALSILVAVVPPGMFWAEEGAGYDVMEYHLELPKEYFQQGAISYTPHNVYGSFPANTEMLYLLCMIVRDDPYAGAATAKLLNAMLAGMFVLGAYTAGRSRSAGCGVATATLAASVGWISYLCGVAYVENNMLFFAMAGAAAVVWSSANGRGSSSATDKPGPRWMVFAGMSGGLAAGCKYTAIGLVLLPLALAAVAASSGRFGKRTAYGAIVLLVGLACVSPWLIKNAAMTGNPVFPLLSQYFSAQPPGWGKAQAVHFAECHRPAPDARGIGGRLSATGGILFDRDQRFGPAVLLLAAIGFARRRTRIGWALLLMVGVQWLLWTTMTHLYVRFAVPMIVPLVLLAGLSVDWGHRAANRVVATIVVLGCLVHAGFAWRLYGEHVYFDGRRIPVEAADRLIMAGAWPGFEAFGAFNNLPENSKLLLVGEARAFFIRGQVDYCVVFNRYGFIELVESEPRPERIVEWLRQRGYTHVAVNWAEVGRLRRSRYGFSAQITPGLFDALARHGLTLSKTFSTGEASGVYGALYEVRGATRRHP